MAVSTVLLAPGLMIAAPDLRFAFFLWLPLLAYLALWVIAIRPAGRG
jgi:hypothetical protein